MLRHSRYLIKQAFTIFPQRANRYFTLTLQTHLQLPLSQLIQEQHKKHIEKYQNNGALLMAYQNIIKQNQNNQKQQKINIDHKQSANFVFWFQSPNQIQAYQFMKNGPFKDYIKKYQIQQIQMQPRVRDKQLAPRNLRQ